MDRQEVDDLFNQLYTVGEERWIRVKFLDKDRAAQWVRLNSHTGSFDNEDKGVEITALGVRDDYMPQVEALVELKAETESWYGQYDTEVMDLFENLIDRKISQVLDKVLISKR